MSDTDPDIAIVGSFIGRPERVVDRSLEEMIFKAAHATAEDAGMSIDEVDDIVISANDEVDGRVISCMVSAGPAAGVDRDLMMIASSSEHALIYAYMKLRAGQCRKVLVLSWGKPSESVFPEHAELVAAEPFILRPHGMNDTLAAALQASVLYAGGDTPVPESSDDDEFVSWPLRRSDLRPRGDAVCGVILTVRDAVPEGTSPVWITGLGWSTDRYEMGDRDLGAMTALHAARKRAYEMAGIRDSQAVQFVRLNCPSSVTFDAALEALLVTAGEARSVDHGGPEELGFPTFARGLAAVALAARDIHKDESQTDRVAVGASLHGFAGQGAAVAVLRASRDGGQA